MAKARPKIEVKFEDQLIAEIQAMVELEMFPPQDIEELKAMEPYALWKYFYKLCEDCDKQLSDFTIGLGNKCFDKMEEFDKFVADQVHGDDVVFPKKEKKKEPTEEEQFKKSAAKMKEAEKNAALVQEKEVILPLKRSAANVVPLPKKERTKKGEIKKAIEKFEKPVAEKKKVVITPKKEVEAIAQKVMKVTAKPKKVAAKAPAAKPMKPQKISAKRKREKYVPMPKDRFGFRDGSTTSKAAELMNGTMTLAQIAKQMGTKQNMYYVVNRLRDKGHTVNFRDSRVTAIAAKKKKVV